MMREWVESEDESCGTFDFFTDDHGQTVKILGRKVATHP